MIESFGALTMPVASSGVIDALAPLDPARYAIGALLQTALNGDCGQAWSKITATLASTHPLYGSKPINDVVELEPDATLLTTRRPKWPLLAVYRTGEARYSWRTLSKYVREQEWNCDLILGPIAADDVRKCGDLCTLFFDIGSAVIRHGFYPGHSLAAPPISGYGNGQPWAVPVSRIEVRKHLGPGWAKATDTAPPYYGATLVLCTWEQSVDLLDVATDTTVDSGAALGFTDVKVGLAVDAIDGVTIPTFVQSGPPAP